MEIFLCTFLIKLQSAKQVQQRKDQKQMETTLEAVWKSARQQTIVAGTKRPYLINGNASFNQKFEIKSDILYDPNTKTYNDSKIVLEISKISQRSTTTHTATFNLTEIYRKSNIPQKQYNLTGGLMACLEMSCVKSQSMGVKVLRRGKSSLQVGKDIKEKGFTKNQNTSPSKKELNQHRYQTPQFRGNEQPFRPFVIKEQIYPLPNQNTELIQIREKYLKQKEELFIAKQTIKSYEKQLNQQQNITKKIKQQSKSLNSLQQKQQKKQLLLQSMEIHLAEAENLCNSLSANLSQKQTEIIDLIEEKRLLKQKNQQFSKKILDNQLIKKQKDESQRMIEQLKKQVFNYKSQIAKQLSSEIANKGKTQLLISQNAALNNKIQKMQIQLNNCNKKIDDLNSKLQKLEQQYQSLIRQTVKWREQFTLQMQQKQKQVQEFRIQNEKLYLRYNQLINKQQLQDKLIKKQVFDKVISEYERKICAFQEKQSILKNQMDVIEVELSNLQDSLEEKEENEEILLDHIKKLQTDVDNYTIRDNWWQHILNSQQEKDLSLSGNIVEGEVAQIKRKNKQLIQLLQKNSMVILQGEKMKKQIENMKKDHEQTIKKNGLLLEELKQIKERIKILMDQNKKLLKKKSQINRQNEQLNKKNIWLSQQNEIIKFKEKQARQDYKIISFRLKNVQSSIEKGFRHSQMKQQHVLRIPNLKLPVIKESYEQLSNSHDFTANGKNQGGKNSSSLLIEVIQKLKETLKDRIGNSQDMHMHLEKVLQSQNLQQFSKQ